MVIEGIEEEHYIKTTQIVSTGIVFFHSNSITEIVNFKNDKLFNVAKPRTVTSMEGRRKRRNTTYVDV